MWHTATAVRAAWNRPPDARAGSRADLYDELAAIAREHWPQPRLLLVADVDDFRTYNTRHGYERGDEMLDVLESRAGSVSRTFRLGADSSALLLEGDVPTLVRQVGLALDRLTLEHPEPLQCSFGVALVPTEAGDSGALALAEERLEDQKRRGLVFADRVGELLLTLTEAHDRTLGTHAREVARLADAVAGRLGLGDVQFVNADVQQIDTFFLHYSEKLSAAGQWVSPPEPQCVPPTASPATSAAPSPSASGS